MVKDSEEIIDTGIKAAPNYDREVPAPYYAKVIEHIDQAPKSFGLVRIGVYKRSGGHLEPKPTDELLGEYTRRMGAVFATFHPFELRGKWYALFSRDYEVTSLMELPSCQEIGSVPYDEFCPVEYWVPPLCYKDYEKDEWVFPDRIHGFVAGCYWGDDSSWKIHYLDLSQADKGIIERDERFGYIELPGALSYKLKKAIDFNPKSGMVKISCDRYFNVISGEEKIYN